jgi:hypothetical protein
MRVPGSAVACLLSGQRALDAELHVPHHRLQLTPEHIEMVQTGHIAKIERNRAKTGGGFAWS